MMVTKNLTNSKGKRIVLSARPIASGGEGQVYSIKQKPGKVAKIYLDSKKAMYMHAKVKYMITYSPFKGASEVVRKSIIWPVDMLFSNGKFVGFIMDKAENSIELTHLILIKSKYLENNPEWKKFNRNSKQFYLYRLIIAYNLAKAIELLHNSGRYVLVDLKPSNVLINQKGHVKLIDMDSIQIIEHGRVKFPAVSYTEDYSPPELKKSKKRDVTSIIPVYWDLFSFSVIIYQLLLGIHPYAASHHDYNLISELIEMGFFANGSNKFSLHTIPKAHHKFRYLPYDMRKFFLETFDRGHINPTNRTGIRNWIQVFKQELKPAFARN
jgi:DNA-binding helix-hairpin-helix protein with protein kinase domain